MKLEDQVLSIEQVQELQELGFDIEKHSSMEVNIAITNKQYIVSSSFFKLYPEFGDDDVIERYSTMTIGDIINILPIVIGKYELNINRRDVSYSESRTNILFYAYRYRFINSLFDCLVWCIKEKHIKL